MASHKYFSVACLRFGMLEILSGLRSLECIHIYIYIYLYIYIYTKQIPALACLLARSAFKGQVQCDLWICFQLCHDGSRARNRTVQTQFTPLSLYGSEPGTGHVTEIHSVSQHAAVHRNDRRQPDALELDLEVLSTSVRMVSLRRGSSEISERVNRVKFGVGTAPGA